MTETTHEGYLLWQEERRADFLKTKREKGEFWLLYS